MSLDNFILGKILGKGSYGSVRIVERKEDHKIYAMKSVVINILNEKEKLNSFNEVRLLASLKHQNIIDYKESFFDNNENTLNIVMEYADDGDLRSKISKIAHDHLSFEETTIWNVLIQTLEGLKYLHKNNIIHRDLKSANIFLTKSGLIKIGDLNVSTILKKGVANTQTGTPYYASPEIWNDKPYNSKTDIWSLGCIIYEMATLHVPFRGTSLHQLFCKIMKGKYLQIPNRYSKDLKNIIKIILIGDPQKRPSAEELLKNEIVIRKAKELGINKTLEDNLLSEKVILIKTIKIPKNISQINKQLPQKRYELIKIKNKEEMFNNDEYEYSKNNFYKLSNKEQNNIIKESIRKNNELKNEKEINAIEPKRNNIGIINANEAINTTNDTDRIYNSENNKNEIIKEEINTPANINNINYEEIDKLIIKSEPMNENEINIIKDNIKKNIENINMYKQRLKKPYKDTGYHFFIKNAQNDQNNNKKIKMTDKKSEIKDKKRRYTQPEKKQKQTSSDIQKLPKIRPKSVKNIIQRNKMKENNSIKNIINNNKKDMRKNSSISANKKNRKNEYNSYLEKEKEKEKELVNRRNKLEKINRNKNFDKENDKNVNNQNLFLVNHKKRAMRPISSRHYDKNKININHEPRSPNINNNKNNINKRKFQIYYNQYFNEKNENKNNKHKIIYEKIEIEKNGKKNKYKRGNAQVKYIDVGNHYNQYKKLMNNNKYIIFECGKKVGPKMILPNKW